MELVDKQTMKVSQATKYEKNPFIEAIVIQTKSKRLTVSKGKSIIDHHTGAIDSAVEVSQVIEVDGGQFVKLFTRDLSIWFDLNKSGIRVFGALLVAVQQSSIGRDIVFLDHNNEIVQGFKMSKQTFYRGLEELLTKGFIARHKSIGWYFINPAMFFNGNRARFIKEYRVKELRPMKCINIENEVQEALLQHNNERK